MADTARPSGHRGSAQEDSAGDNTVVVGRIGPARGVKGHVFVAPATDDPAQRFAAGAVLRTDRPDRPSLTVLESSLAGGRLVVWFEGCHSRAEAEALRGLVLSIDVAARPELDDPDDFYDTDLIGLAVRDTQGADLGAVTSVIHGGAHDLLEVRSGGRSHLVPFVKPIVPSIDLDAGLVTIDPPDGLFEL